MSTSTPSRYISRLREKFRGCPDFHIRTIRGFGYMALPGGKRMANKPDKIPSSLRWTTFWIVFALIVLSVALALALYSAGQYLVLLLGVDVQPDAYMLWVPLIALAVSAILGTVLAIVLNRYYLRPVAQLLRRRAPSRRGTSASASPRARTRATSPSASGASTR